MSPRLEKTSLTTHKGGRAPGHVTDQKMLRVETTLNRAYRGTSPETRVAFQLEMKQVVRILIINKPRVYLRKRHSTRRAMSTND